jgi:Zn-dependent protease with chaperone function
MPRWLTTIIVALAIPVAGLLVISGADAATERQWRESIVAEFGAIPDDQADRLRLSVLCDDPQIGAELGSACQDTRLAAGGRAVAFVAFLLSLALLGFIGLTHVVTVRDRRSLARIFRPGLYVVLISLAVLTLADGAIVMLAAYLGEGMLFGVTHPVVIFGIAVAVLVAAYGVVRAVVTMGRRRPIEVEAVQLNRADHPRLFELVDEAARTVDTQAPDAIVAGLEPNFFVTESDVKTPGAVHRGRTLYVSVAALRVIDRDELLAIVGHELGHFKGEDTFYSERFYPIYRGAIQSLGVLQATARGFAAIPLAAPLLILGRFFESFSVPERQMSRDRELAADVVGAQLTSRQTMATALVKLHAIVPDWSDTARSAVVALRDGVPIGNISTRFADRVALGARVGHLAELLEEHTPHPIDSHPPLRARLEALETPIEAVSDQAARLAPTDAAADLLGDAEAVEASLSQAFVDTATTVLNIGQVLDVELAATRTAALTAAAEGDPLISDVVSLFQGLRGPALTRPFLPAAGWISLIDLEYGPHPEPQPFLPLVPEEDIPGGDQHLVLRIADATTAPRNRLLAGTRFQPVGINNSAWRKDGWAEDTYAVDDQVFAVRGVGDWPVEQQLAGLFVVPASDPLAGVDSRFADQVRAIGAAFRIRRRAESPPDKEPQPAIAPA